MKWLALVVVLVLACNRGEPLAQPQHIEMIDAPATADVAPLIANEIARATRDNRRLLVYVGASWCEPCRHFHDAAAAGKLDAEFGTVRLLVFDEDRDEPALARAHYKHELIPLFALPSADGTGTGKQIEGSIKGADAVAQISPRLHALLDGADVK